MENSIDRDADVGNWGDRRESSRSWNDIQYRLLPLNKCMQLRRDSSHCWDARARDLRNRIGMYVYCIITSRAIDQQSYLLNIQHYAQSSPLPFQTSIVDFQFHSQHFSSLSLRLSSTSPSALAYREYHRSPALSSPFARLIM